MKKLFGTYFVALILFNSCLQAQCTIDISASASSVCSGQSVVLTAVTQGCGNDRGFLWSTGQTSQSITVIPVNSGAVNINIIYTVTVYMTDSSSAGTKRITVKAIPESIITNNTPVICNEDSANLILSSNTPGTAYTWTATASNVTGISNGTGPLIQQFLSNSGGSNGYAVYYITPKAGGCTGATRADTVKVSQKPEVIIANNSPVICSGQNTGIQLSSTIPGSSFSWVTDSFDVSGGYAGNGNLIEQNLYVTINGTGSLVYKIQTAHSGCASEIVQAIVRVHPLPLLYLTGIDAAICSNDTTAISLASVPEGATFRWSALGSNVTGASDGSGDSIIHNLIAQGNSGKVIYSVIATLEGCESFPVYDSIIVHPLPSVSISPLNTQICSGASTNLQLNSNPAGALFNWTTSATSLSGASAGSGFSLQQVLDNRSFAIDSVTYIIQASLNGCNGLPDQVTVKVSPVPTAISSPDSSVICSLNSTNILLTSNSNNTIFSWTARGNDIIGYSNGSGNYINQTLRTTGSTPGMAIYQIVPTLYGCQGPAIEAVVIVNACLDKEEHFKSGADIISLYPNPAHEEFTLTLNSLLFQNDIQWELCELSGKILASSTLDKDDQINNKINIKADFLKQGVYFISINSGQSRFVKKLVIQ